VSVFVLTVSKAVTFGMKAVTDGGAVDAGSCG
jgi:hypothetical protein